MMGRRRTMAAAASCSLLLSSCALPALANQADLFFDFSSKIRVGTTSSAGGDESSKTTPAAAAAETAAAVENSPAVTPDIAQAELEAIFAEQVEEVLLELEALLESYNDGLGDDASFATVDAALNMTTESLLSLSAQVPANSSAEEWISAYGLMSSEQQGYYNAEATGYTT